MRPALPGASVAAAALPLLPIALPARPSCMRQARLLHTQNFPLPGINARL
ncbi:exported protein of unknown function [Cupriavidus taiwanensis]|uniref:Uncharacterized protein n=1 Tax=Cupriavidus taiwanensis TaxID=164546 RepID=A0A375GRD2_9BURK|nr:exported hypothetical protein [Cupriavidus taiwanensis]SOZ81408.1 exported hypothetical protein [Cupriavidus taiwanensis]SPA16069.1 exported hypothetical protein [Cupriavidus taiwanensis]SPD40144.1 protein of unknown function [Cupriavidus taiwanensis]SPK73642.1 exported protein of unknown function [Cupriavidus taiwanensis]